MYSFDAGLFLLKFDFSKLIFSEVQFSYNYCTEKEGGSN